MLKLKNDLVTKNKQKGDKMKKKVNIDIFFENTKKR